MTGLARARRTVAIPRAQSLIDASGRALSRIQMATAIEMGNPTTARRIATGTTSDMAGQHTEILVTAGTTVTAGFSVARG